ncbi:hypothetical protein HO291_003479 [Salmonella enterica]|nr:hypothetical protein [Salmonella enterica]
MAAIITLTEARKAKLVKLLNNLNLGFVYSGFGEAFTAMLDGAPLTLDEAHKAELKHLINNLNLGTFHAKAGDLLVDMMDHGTANTTAQAMTETQKTQLAALFHNLNMGLAEVDVGDLIVAAVEDLGHPNAVPKLVWDGTQPTTGNVGDTLKLSWKGGKGQYNVKVTDPDGIVDDRGAMPSLTIQVNTAGKKAGAWKVEVTDETPTTITQNITISPALAAPTFTTQPKAATLNEGTAGSMTAAADGNPAPTLQWQKSATQAGTFTNVAGKTTGTLAFTGARSEAGFYKCVATNSQASAGVSSSVVQLTITLKSITAKADPGTATGGDIIDFATMFDAKVVTAKDFDFVVSGGDATGKVDTDGKLTLADAATGTVTVTANAKTAAGTVDGTGAVFTITTVTPK